MKKILLIEDEEAIREFVVINLRRSGFDVVAAGSGEEGLSLYEQEPGAFVVILLDIMLPGMDGFAVCKRIRETDPKVGIIMLSAKAQEMDKVGGFQQGADDYITKPFSPSELIARIDALTRRVEALSPGTDTSGDVLRAGPFELGLKSRSLYKNGAAIDVTQVEFQIMEFFMSHPNTAFERSAILSQVWGEGYVGDVKIVDVNIRRLRLKIEDDPSNPRHLVTVWGYGYKWND